MPKTLQLFNFGKRNRLSLCPVVDDDDHDLIIGRWLSGRIFGRYVSVFIPWKQRR
jgi:hypothetical protein